MIDKRKAVQILSLLLYLGVVSTIVIDTVHEYSDLPPIDHTLFTDFWYIQLGGPECSVMFHTLSMILFTTFSSYIFIYIKNNQSFLNVHQRIGYKGFVRTGFIRTFLAGAFLSALTLVYELVLFAILLKQVPSNIKLEECLIQPPFDDNTISSWLIFVLLSSIGWGIYAMFIYSVGLFINKNSVFIIIGAVIGILLIIGPVLLLVSEYLAFPLTVILFQSLTAPGQLNFNVYNAYNYNVFLISTLSGIFYLTASLGLANLWIKTKQKNG